MSTVPSTGTSTTGMPVDGDLTWSSPVSRSRIRVDDVHTLLGAPPRPPAPFLVQVADSTAELRRYAELRRDAFVREQGLFDGDDADERDADPRTLVLLARDAQGEVLGGVRLGPVDSSRDIGWWRGGRLVVSPAGQRTHGVGAALVRAAAAHAETGGALRFDATVQLRVQHFFERLGWTAVADVVVADRPHVLMNWPIGRITRLVEATKQALAQVLDGVRPGGSGFVGDDGAPVPGSDLVAACDAIVPAMVERDPEWAGWCSVLVNLNDLAAMGAAPVAILDAVGARDASTARRVMDGILAAAQAWDVPLLGGHTQFGVPASLAVTALGRTVRPIPGGGGRPGDVVRLTADVAGGWRPGYGHAQWDSSSTRSPEDLRTLTSVVARMNPSAAKDVSMTGVVGTLGMMAEASGCGAVLDVASVPAPATAGVADWLTCFPGFGMLTAHRPGSAAPAPPPPELTAPAVSAACGELVAGTGVLLRWPDGLLTAAVAGGVTGMGPA